MKIQPPVVALAGGRAWLTYVGADRAPQRLSTKLIKLTVALVIGSYETKAARQLNFSVSLRFVSLLGE